MKQRNKGKRKHVKGEKVEWKKGKGCVKYII